MDIYKVANQMKTERKTIFDLPIKVTFYARVSTTREEQENSIEHQISYFTDMIQNNSNWTYIEGYVDRIRGENASNREEFMRMIEDGKSGAFDLVLTKEVSRFARNTVDSLVYTRDLLRSGVGVFFQNDNICTVDTDSELRLTIMSSIAADEVRKLSERVRWGHKRSIEQGAVMGNSRIFGYDKNDCKLVINESEAEMIRLIFHTYSTGNYSIRKIEDIIYEKGYRSRNNTRIHHNTISGIIQNPKYKGYYCGNKVRIVDYRTKQQRFLPEKEWIMYKDETGEVVPAIVDEELWDKCNEIFKERSNIVKSRAHSLKDKSVFTGKIWCGVHQKPYWRTSYSNTSSKGESIYQWICSEKKRYGAKICISFSIMEKELYTILSDYFKGIAENIEEYVNDFIKIYTECDKDVTTQKQINDLKHKIIKEKCKKEKLLDLYVDGLINKKEFSDRNEALNVIIYEMEEALSEMENKSKEDTEYLKSVKKIQSFFKTMYTTSKEMDDADVDQMVRSIVDRIDVVPVNKQEMRMDIKLKTGIKGEINYVRNGERYACRSGLISKKMIKSYEESMK